MSTVDRRPSEYASSAAAAATTVSSISAPAKSGFRLRTFDALHFRDYRFLWIGILFTSSGMWMEQVALNWIVYGMTGSAVDLAILNGMRALPSLITGPFGGVAADRMDRKKLMLTTGWALVALYVMLAALIFSGSLELWHLMAFSLATGMAWTFNQPVRQALIPSLVPPEAMMNAVALQSTAFNVTRILGPALGGLLMGTLGAGGTIVAVTISFLGVQVFTSMMKVPAHEPRGGSAKDVWRDLIEGFRYIGRTPDVRGLIIMARLRLSDVGVGNRRPERDVDRGLAGRLSG
ncbi:MAG: MFS transporter [Chloroflexi bacterium]|nr:MFS transporter [Chloroflexota bacterium]